ncbi:cytochrome C [Pandoraea captiosa]|uniref:Cytochrome C n=2 Tax=Pandoraea captiosa TaxID=2508302 RepID=A0A5E5A3C5_9BURK|nr:cytochrome C [Pandoraea captiosa]
MSICVLRAGIPTKNVPKKTMKKFLTMMALALGSTSLMSLSALHAAELKPDMEAAKGKVAMCIGCHGIPDYRTAFPEVYHVPKIGGQNAKYIENALKEYAKGDRKFQTMHGIAATLTDQDIVDIAAYYAAQTASTPVNPQK